MTLSIRKMDKTDIPQVHKLGISQEAFSSKNGAFWTEEQLYKWSQSPTDVLLIAEENSIIVGFSFYSTHVPTGKVTWENLYVIPEARKTGVGSHLVEEGLKQIRSLGFTYIMGCVHAVDQENFASFVEKFNFTVGDKVTWIDQIIDSDNNKSEQKLV
jgi:ribosomal protein S18 acetylase RimI-like enzyme